MDAAATAIVDPPCDSTCDGPDSTSLADKLHDYLYIIYSIHCLREIKKHKFTNSGAPLDTIM